MYSPRMFLLHRQNVMAEMGFSLFMSHTQTGRGRNRKWFFIWIAVHTVKLRDISHRLPQFTGETVQISIKVPALKGNKNVADNTNWFSFFFLRHTLELSLLHFAVKISPPQDLFQKQKIGLSHAFWHFTFKARLLTAAKRSSHFTEEKAHFQLAFSENSSH